MTDVPGLGVRVPDGWSVALLEDVTSKIGSGATPRGGASVYVEAGPSFIRSQNVYDNAFKDGGLVHLSAAAAHDLRGVTVHENDVLINITGDSILRTCLVPPLVLPARVNQHVSIVRSNGKVTPIILQKWLSQPLMKEFMLGHSSGGTRKAITKGHLQSFPILVPPAEEQLEISATLTAIDDSIDSSRGVIELALQLLDALSSQFSTELPTVPLGSLVTVARDAVDPTKLGETIVDQFSLPAFDDGARPEITPASSIMSGKLLLRRVTILVSRLNPRFNRSWWAAPRNGVPALASPEFAPLSADSPESLAAVWLAIRDEYFRDELARRVTGTSGSHQRVRLDDMLSVLVPNVALLNDGQKSRALSLLQLVQEKRDEAAALERLRDSLLPELLSGRIRVTEIAAPERATA